MTKENSTVYYPINTLSVIEIIGADAITFLQGQLTTNLTTLSIGQWQRTAFCSRQGRVLANGIICRLAAHNEENTLLLIVSDDLAKQTVDFIKRFILRAKVNMHVLNKITSVVWKQTFPSTTIASRHSGHVEEKNNRIRIDISDAYDLVLSATEDEIIKNDDHTAYWQQCEILQGIPWIRHCDEDRFIPQFVNIDVIDGIDFNKGCFVGQEVIARLHHLGKVKRRGMIISSQHQIPLQTKTIKNNKDGNVGEVVNNVITKEGYMAFASIMLSALNETLTIDKMPIKIANPPYTFPVKEVVKRTL